MGRRRHCRNSIRSQKRSGVYSRAKRPSLWRHLKVEALEGRLLLAADFGDSPQPYPTMLADNGARHELTGPILGGIRDGEIDGIPSTHAMGDDAAGVDDEDGVV